MQAWLLDESPGAYRYGEVDLAEPGPGEVWVRVVTSALNHLDLWMRKAMPKPPMFPMVPGCDGAGTVDAVGDGVTRWQPGDEVIINPSFACGRCLQCLSDRSVFCPEFGIMGEHYWGAHGELVVAREANLVAKPPALSWEAAAAYPLCGLTVYRMLQRARLAAGETLLIVGAGGGVGSAALAIGQQMGARVYVTSRDPAKRAHALELGALGAFASDEKVPLKADVVVDTVGSPTWAFSMGALVPGGRIVTCGGTGGGRVELNLAKLFFGQYEIVGSTMGTFREFDELTRLVAAGLPVQVDSVYPLADYPSALVRMEAGTQFGKVVLRHP